MLPLWEKNLVNKPAETTRDSLDDLSHTFAFMNPQVIHHHDLSRFKAWAKNPLHIKFKSGCLYGSLQDKASPIPRKDSEAMSVVFFPRLRGTFPCAR